MHGVVIFEIYFDIHGFLPKLSLRMFEKII